MSRPDLPYQATGRREALRAVIDQYKIGSENDPASWWYSEALADLGHLWLENPDADLGGFLDAITKAIEWIETEQMSLRNGIPLP
jgi:hypothetical protein